MFKEAIDAVLSNGIVTLYSLNTYVKLRMLRGPRPKWGYLFKKTDRNIFQSVQYSSTRSIRIRKELNRDDISSLFYRVEEFCIRMADLHLSTYNVSPLKIFPKAAKTPAPLEKIPKRQPTLGIPPKAPPTPPVILAKVAPTKAPSDKLITYFEVMFPHLLEFKRTRGHCNVPYKYETQGCKLGMWVADIRSSNAIDNRDFHMRLDKIGFWDTSRKPPPFPPPPLPEQREMSEELALHCDLGYEVGYAKGITDGFNLSKDGYNDELRKMNDIFKTHVQDLHLQNRQLKSFIDDLRLIKLPHEVKLLFYKHGLIDKRRLVPERDFY